MESFKRFDEIVDTVQYTKLTSITDKQKAKYKFAADFEYGLDEEERYVIRGMKEMLDEMEYYMAL